RVTAVRYHGTNGDAPPPSSSAVRAGYHLRGTAAAAPRGAPRRSSGGDLRTDPGDDPVVLVAVGVVLDAGRRARSQHDGSVHPRPLRGSERADPGVGI